MLPSLMPSRSLFFGDYCTVGPGKTGFTPAAHRPWRSPSLHNSPTKQAISPSFGLCAPDTSLLDNYSIRNYYLGAVKISLKGKFTHRVFAS